MERLATILSRIPLWCRATAVISLGIALAVWFSAEATRQMDQRFLLGEVRIAAQRHTDLLSGLLSEAVVTGNRKAANAIVRQYTTDWTDITFIHVTDENAQVFVEWHRRPVVFGDGILKFESPVT